MHPKMVRMIKFMQEKEKAGKRKKLKEKWFLYILECRDGSLYTGITKDLARRLQMHEKGRGAKYTRSRRPLTMIYSETCKSRIRALVRECAIKKLSRKKKDELILVAGGRETGLPSAAYLHRCANTASPRYKEHRVRRPKLLLSTDGMFP